MRALKALADPARLRIVRYLHREPSIPAELAGASACVPRLSSTTSTPCAWRAWST
jgi:DNA-binding transcriptional ArsR family regulator